MGKSKLTDKQELFCLEYVVDFNATRAYKAAGYTGKGAGQSAAALLKNPKIQNRLKELKTPRQNAPKNLRERVLEELEAIAFANAGDFFEEIKVEDEDGKVTHSYRQIRPDVLDSPHIAAIQSFEPSAYGQKIKVADKQKALEMLARHIGLFNADTTQKPENTNVVDLSGMSSEKLKKLQKVWKENDSE